jgi:hypothetical protein
MARLHRKPLPAASSLQYIRAGDHFRGSARYDPKDRSAGASPRSGLLAASVTSGGATANHE